MRKNCVRMTKIYFDIITFKRCLVHPNRKRNKGEEVVKKKNYFFLKMAQTRRNQGEPMCV